MVPVAGIASIWPLNFFKFVVIVCCIRIPNWTRVLEFLVGLSAWYTYLLFYMYGRWGVTLSRRESYDPINWFSYTTLLYLSKARTWISNVTCGLFCIQEIRLRWEVVVRFVVFVGIDGHHCLNFLFIIIIL